MTYPGGKNGSGVYQRIINLMPPHDLYIEPFLGSGAVMRLKRPARLNIGLDLEEAALKLASPPGRLPAGSSCETGDVGSPAPRRRRSPIPAMEYSGRGAPEMSMEACGTAARFPAMLDPDHPRARNGEGRSTGDPGGLARFGEERSRFSFRHGDGIEFLETYPFQGNGREVVYCDPPYLMLSERSGRPIYNHEMSEEEHCRLLRLIRRLPCLILISGYWSALYARELKAWNHITFEGRTRKGTKTEWLWFNFPEPVELHDYRYLGSGFRERERIKRKTARWTAKLERMPALERQALLAAVSSIAGNADW